MLDAIYIHIPFCNTLCNYCDFLSFSNTTRDERKKYVDYLIKEIKMYTDKNKTQNSKVDSNLNHDLNSESEVEFDTVYFGGGTPSILDPEDLKKILDVLNIKEGCEITLEVNPKSVDFNKLKKFRDIGINRLSIGIQSFNDDKLKVLGRAHKSFEGEQCYLDAREAGFKNISLDLIFSLPDQTLEGLEQDLEKLFSLEPEHFSIYSLIWEEGTPFYEDLKKGVLKESDNDLEAEMFNLIIEKSKKKMYNHYEVSNFAKKNYESRHNSKYWRNCQYLGVGLGASGYIDNLRYKNFSDFQEYYMYIDSNKKPVDPDEIETVDAELKELYRNILGLRLLKEGVTPSEKYFEKFKKLEEEGFLKKVGNVREELGVNEDSEVSRYILTEKGLLLANDVFQELI